MQLSSRRQLALAQASQAKRCSRNVEHNCPILTDTQFSYSRKTLMIDFGTSTPFFFDVRWNGMDQNRGFCWKKNPKEKQTPWGTELRCCGCYVRLVMDTWIHTWVLEVKSILRKISWKWFLEKIIFFYFTEKNVQTNYLSIWKRYNINLKVLLSQVHHDFLKLHFW